MKKTLLLALTVAALLLSCGKGGSQYCISGIVNGAPSGSIIYLQQTGGSGNDLVDSVVLSEDGEFSFKGQGYHYPSFFALRYGNEYIHLVADSLTDLKIKASALDFGRNYQFERADSSNVRIRRIRMLNMEASTHIDGFAKRYQSGELHPLAYRDSVMGVVNWIKDLYVRDFIFSNPRSSEAYCALFQDKDGLLFFDPQDSTDSRAFASVATAYELYYPDAPYTANLKAMTLNGIASIRSKRAHAARQHELVQKAQAVFLPPLALIDEKGEKQDLNDVVARSNRVLLVFTSHIAEWSPSLVQNLRKLYKVEHSKGFEIYEVSVDQDLFFWQNAVRSIPWITVNNASSESLHLFGVNSLPALFIIQSERIKRITDISQIFQLD
ncbi:MAG: DUF4369 domain-containing protein [Porphyromonas sp.]|nr:DUF4369 domain-containing protein [Porphyromonas sp.]